MRRQEQEAGDQKAGAGGRSRRDKLRKLEQEAGAGRRTQAKARTRLVSFSPCSCLLLLPPALGSATRALLLAALIIVGYVLVKYWQSLVPMAPRIRRTLIVLRGTSLVLVACALAGLVLEYDSPTQPRVLVVSKRESGSQTSSDAYTSATKIEDTLTRALESKGFEVVDKPDGDFERAEDSFVAAALLTDGAMTSLDAREQVERISAMVGGAPVYAVGSFHVSKVPSVALESVTVLGPVLRGVPVAVRCVVHSRGMKGRESLVTVSDDAKVQASARVAWTLDDERQAAEITLVPKVTGWAPYVAKVEAAGDDAASRLSRSFTLYVEDRRLRVLFFEGEPTWESKFIRRALDQSGLFEVDYFAQVSRAATVGTSTEGPEIENEGEPGKVRGAPDARLHAILRSSVALNAYDTVIVGASPNALLPAPEGANLRIWVERRGGGLIVLGGNSFNGSIAASGGKLNSFLPAEVNTQRSDVTVLSQGRPLEAENTRGNLVLTPTAEGTGVLTGYLNASEETGSRNPALTGEGFRVGALRPGATILAVAGQPNADGTSEAGQALVAAMNYGAGRTVIFAPADSWRLRTNSSGEEDRTGGQFNALWQGMVMWSGARARPGTEIVLSDESPASGSEVTAEIRVRDSLFAPVKVEKLNVRMQLLMETGQAESVAAAQELAFTPDSVDPSLWRGRVRMLGPGRFALQADYVASGKKATVEKLFAVGAASPHAPGTAYDTLRRVTREKGGEFATLDELEAFLHNLPATSSSSATVHRTWELRSWWPLAFLVPLLLSAEWFLRRWWRVD